MTSAAGSGKTMILKLLNGRTTCSFAGWHPDYFGEGIHELLEKPSMSIIEAINDLDVLIVELNIYRFIFRKYLWMKSVPGTPEHIISESSRELSLAWGQAVQGKPIPIDEYRVQDLKKSLNAQISSSTDPASWRPRRLTPKSGPKRGLVNGTIGVVIGFAPDPGENVMVTEMTGQHRDFRFASASLHGTLPLS
ncbi:uncharacterized protein RCO7_01903 [Rhynchosporium graminicola]|uniref:Uncharacterized protein n=1 Tax=Rhynchosporium graminicola TaxID=2792576 RepID=A0A1E1KU70_9HELO|nr:uncharacterized protein RCO7_01903 [Rhynchosporium commune]